MTNHIGELIRKKREKQGLKRSKLASMVGYSNISKGCRKITELERDGINRPDLLKKLIKALEISKEDLQEAYRKEKADFENCLNVPMKMIVRYMPAVYVSHEIPNHIVTADDAAQYVKDFTADKNLKVCLVLNRRWSFWCDKGEGIWRETTYENQINRPYMSIGGRPFQISADEIFDFYTGGSMKFELKEEEMKRYDRWKKEHDKNCRYLYTGAAGGRMSFCFSPNALGMTEKIVYCACGAFKHLSDPGDD